MFQTPFFSLRIAVSIAKGMFEHPIIPYRAHTAVLGIFFLAYFKFLPNEKAELQKLASNKEDYIKSLTRTW